MGMPSLKALQRTLFLQDFCPNSNNTRHILLWTLPLPVTRFQPSLPSKIHNHSVTTMSAPAAPATYPATEPAIAPAPAPAPAPVPAPAHAHASTGPINDQDIEDWKRRVNEVLAKPGDVVKSKSPASAGGWSNSFFGCFNPIDLCLITWCLPCVTFGKTHHRVRKDAKLQGYEPINTSVSVSAGSCRIPSANT